tara:strand:+ start:346 stop:513 length:168 start_codon:yes stop_codon:yes gene_type:complete
VVREREREREIAIASSGQKRAGIPHPYERLLWQVSAALPHLLQRLGRCDREERRG